MQSPLAQRQFPPQLQLLVCFQGLSRFPNRRKWANRQSSVKLQHRCTLESRDGMTQQCIPFAVQAGPNDNLQWCWNQGARRAGLGTIPAGQHTDARAGPTTADPCGTSGSVPVSWKYAAPCNITSSGGTCCGWVFACLSLDVVGCAAPSNPPPPPPPSLVTAVAGCTDLPPGLADCSQWKEILDPSLTPCAPMSCCSSSEGQVYADMFCSPIHQVCFDHGPDDVSCVPGTACPPGGSGLDLLLVEQQQPLALLEQL